MPASSTATPPTASTTTNTADTPKHSTMPTDAANATDAAAARTQQQQSSPSAIGADVAFAAPTLTKIVATLGPSTDQPGVVERLITAGVSVFRLNFSHGDLDAHHRRLRMVRDASDKLGQPVAVLGDLPGPKIRVGRIIESGVQLERGDSVLLLPDENAPAQRTGNEVSLPTDYSRIGREVMPGHRVLINDGAIRMLCVDRDPSDPPDVLRCVVTVGGLVTSRKGINLPESSISAPAVGEDDRMFVEWAVRHGVDFLALSFVRKAEEVRELQQLVRGMCSVERDVDPNGYGAMIPVIAKIEKPQAVERIDEIIEASDAIMVARGDLGVEMDIAQVPVVQKTLLERCDAWGKPSIVATQMLESMINGPSPTRAEASDVANAVFDCCDAVMLSGETAVGVNPVIAVETMRRIAQVAEHRVVERLDKPSPSCKLRESGYRTAALAHGAWYTARDINAKLIVCWSQNGGTARYLSQNGFPVPIVAYSSDPVAVRRMMLLRGVTALQEPMPTACTAALADWNRRVEADLMRRGWVRPGEPILLLAGQPLGQVAATNTFAIHYIGNPVTGFMAHG